MSVSSLPQPFVFSQSSLQDWAECPRRFMHRYLEQRAYPAPVTANMLDYEMHTLQGDLFHRLVQQHLLGIDAEKITPQIVDETVLGWWNVYLARGLEGVPASRHPEVTLTVPLGKHRLLAKYDLLAFEPSQQALIVDWKTAQHRPSQARFAQRLQTIVYRYVLVEAGAYYNGGHPISPEQVTMRYWFVNHPNEPLVFTYSAAEHAAAHDYLLGLVAQIEQSTGFPKVEEAVSAKVCGLCSYRALCWDHVQAAGFSDEDIADDTLPMAAPVVTLDFDQIGEIEF